jgi:integrase
MFVSESIQAQIAGREYTIKRHGNRFRWEIRDGRGERVRRSFGSLREAETELRAELSRAHRRKAKNAHSSAGIFTFGDIVAMWYERKKRFLDEGGQLDYEDRIRRDVAKISHWIPEQVRRSDIEDFYATLTAHSAHRLHPILNQAFEYAIENEWVAVTQNPFRRIKPRRPPSKEIEVPTAREVEKMLIEAQDLPWYIFLRLSSALGTRRSETVVLRWLDIDFERQWIHVRHAYAMKTKALKLPKTHGARTLRFEPGDDTDFLFEELTVFRAESAAGDFLFPPRRSDSVSPCWHPDGVSHRFKRFASTLGLEFAHPHCLRHFVATQLLDLGMSPTQVARWLGHKDDTQVRRLYGNHIREDTQRAIGAAAAGLAFR